MENNIPESAFAVHMALSRLFLVTVRNYTENQVDSLRLTSTVLQCEQNAEASSSMDESFVIFKALVSREIPVSSSLLS